jgi:hypothetical protein
MDGQDEQDKDKTGSNPALLILSILSIHVKAYFPRR